MRSARAPRDLSALRACGTDVCSDVLRIARRGASGHRREGRVYSHKIIHSFAILNPRSRIGDDSEPRSRTVPSRRPPRGSGGCSAQRAGSLRVAPRRPPRRLRSSPRASAGRWGRPAIRSGYKRGAAHGQHGGRARVGEGTRQRHPTPGVPPADATRPETVGNGRDPTGPPPYATHLRRAKPQYAYRVHRYTPD